mgnify:CR=1 FL=1
MIKKNQNNQKKQEEKPLTKGTVYYELGKLNNFPEGEGMNTVYGDIWKTVSKQKKDMSITKGFLYGTKHTVEGENEKLYDVFSGWRCPRGERDRTPCANQLPNCVAGLEIELKELSKKQDGVSIETNAPAKKWQRLQQRSSELPVSWKEIYFKNLQRAYYNNWEKIQKLDETNAPHLFKLIAFEKNIGKTYEETKEEIKTLEILKNVCVLRYKNDCSTCLSKHQLEPYMMTSGKGLLSSKMEIPSTNFHLLTEEGEHSLKPEGKEGDEFCYASEELTSLIETLKARLELLKENGWEPYNKWKKASEEKKGYNKFLEDEIAKYNEDLAGEGGKTASKEGEGKEGEKEGKEGKEGEKEEGEKEEEEKTTSEEGEKTTSEEGGKTASEEVNPGEGGETSGLGGNRKSKKRRKSRRKFKKRRKSRRKSRSKSRSKSKKRRKSRKKKKSRRRRRR